jgi:hypothetical protein
LWRPILVIIIEPKPAFLRFFYGIIAYFCYPKNKLNKSEMETLEMKQTLTTKLVGLLQSEDIASVSSEIKKLQKEYDLVLAKQTEKEKETFREDGGNMRDFVFQKNSEDKNFDVLIKQFDEKRKAYDNKLAADQEKNYLQKKQIVVEIEQLVNIEQGASIAFKELKLLQDKWEHIGAVSPHKYKELQSEYSKSVEKFYYNLNIYRVMQEHDLKKNFELKNEVIQNIKKLLEKDNVKEIENLIRSYRSEFDASGPVGREHWEAVKEDYKQALDAVYNKVKSHYTQQEEEKDKNLNAKKEILEKAVQVVSAMPATEPEWKSKTDVLIALQNDYKHTGFADKKQGDKVYNEFRTVCDKFFEEKAKFYEVIREQSSGVRKEKLAIIQKVETIQNSTDWKNSTNEIIKLQEDWKKSGVLPRNEDQRLFGRLRTACNHFFEEKRKFYENLDAQYVGNLKLKEDLIAEVTTFQLSGDNNADRNTLKDFSQRFQAAGLVPMKDKERINNSFYKLLDDVYNKLNVNATEKAQMQYSDKLDQLSASQSPDYNLRKEMDFLKKQQQDLEKNIQTFERNLGFFNTSKGKNPLVVELEGKIEVERNKITSLIKKQKSVKEYLDKLFQPKLAAEVENTNSSETKA